MNQKIRDSLGLIVVGIIGCLARVAGGDNFIGMLGSIAMIGGLAGLVQLAWVLFTYKSGESPAEQQHTEGDR